MGSEVQPERSILNRRVFKISQSWRQDLWAGKAHFCCEKMQPAPGEILAAIGRELREQCDDPQLLSERVAELVRKIEQSTNE
jgi:hypothetical protein